MTETSSRASDRPWVSDQMLIATSEDLQNAADWLKTSVAYSRRHSVPAPLTLDLLDRIIPAVRDLSAFSAALIDSLRTSLDEYEVIDESGHDRDPAAVVDQAAVQLAAAHRQMRDGGESLTAVKEVLTGLAHDGLRRSN